MKLISWNVNGIRAVLKKGFLDYLKKEKPDFLCVQEIKISQEAKEKEDFDFLNYDIFWNHAQRPGYSGTAILFRKDNKDIVSFSNGMGIEKFDNEGRLQTIELKKFYLLNIYFPNANNELSRLGYKTEFNNELLKYVKKLEKKKPVVITGDYNVAHQEIDLARPKQNVGSPGFTPEERAWMDEFIENNFIDTFRYVNGDKVQYSWWSYRANARVNNVGWRIDYFCVSDKLKKTIKKAYIRDQVKGSDHAPVGLEI